MFLQDKPKTYKKIVKKICFKSQSISVITFLQEQAFPHRQVDDSIP